MISVMRRCIQLFIVLAAIACSFSAQAAYTFAIVKYPGAFVTALSGVNNSGQILGQAALSADPNAPRVNFLYDAYKKTFTPVPPVPGEGTGLLGINDPGVMVGSIAAEVDNGGNVITPEIGLIRSTKGKFTMFSHPGPLDNTEARAVNNSGRVTGFAYNDDGDNFLGFIYDPTNGSFTDLPFVGSQQLIFQGINTSGQAVGSVALPDLGLYAGYPFGIYGFLRNTNGAITVFQVNGVCTRARGINDSGQIAGWTRPCAPGAHVSGFVGTLVGPSFQTLNVPGATDTFAQGINNAGQIVGSADSDGFIASLIATNKDQCTNGWQSLSRANGTFFKNQGDCIQYVNTGK